MATAAYNTQAGNFSKRVQWLVEIDLDRCAEQYTQAPCTAADQGDGSRCWYSFLTCQDPANYNKTTRTYRFCLNNVPWPDPATAVYPLLRRMVPVPQKIDPSKLFGYPEQISVEMVLDYDPLAIDSDKGTGFFNTSNTIGEFWKNLFARNRNYPGKPMRVKRGFHATGFLLSDFLQVGPEYKLKEVKFERNSCTIVAESPLAELNKRQIPYSISEDNTIQDSGGINNSVTTVNVNDGTEYPDPADFTRNTVYVRMDAEICSVSSITANALTIARGAFGTTAVAHDAGVKVEHVACFGNSDGTAYNSIEAMQDLMEWAGIAAAGVDTTEFDDVKAIAWPDEDVRRVVTKTQKVAKLLQQLREIRGVMIFLDVDGDWSCALMGPNVTGSALDDDYFVKDSIRVMTDEDDRITRVSLWYDPTEENATDTDKFDKSVQVQNATLEGANFFNDVKEEVVLDHWIHPDFTVAKIRNMARRIITRRGYGIRTIRFAVEVKDGILDVGDIRDIQTRHATGIVGEQVVIPAIITAKRDIGDGGQIEYEAVDTNFSGRFFRIAPDTVAADYDNATDADKEYGYWGTATNNRVGDKAEDGYIFW